MYVPSEVKFSYGANSITATLNNGTITAGTITIYLNVPSDTAPEAAYEAGYAFDTSGNVIGLVGPVGTIAFSQILSQSGIPFILPSSGTMGNNGALTALTALAQTYSDGCYMYFAAAQIAAGSTAGWYWTVMSSTTAGTVFNNVYTSGQPTVPSSNTAFATTGPGAITGVTTSIPAITVSLVGGSMGNNGELTFEMFDVQPNTAGTKSLNVTLGGTIFFTNSATTSAAPNSARWIVRNRGRKDRQVYHNAFNGEPTYQAGSVGNQSIDTSITQTVTISLQHVTAATDWMVLEGHSIQLIPGA